MSRTLTATASKPRKSRAPRRAPAAKPPVTRTYYLAYGSNLNRHQMAWRCPAAEPVGTVTVPDVRLVFRGVADVEAFPGAECPMGLWTITPECERELDIYEGYRPGNRGLYRKEYISLEVTAKDGTKSVVQALIYIMNADYYGKPSRGYYETISQGYRDFNIPQDALLEARELTRQIMEGQAA